MTTPYKFTSVFYDHATAWTGCEDDAGHSTDGGRVFGITRTRYAECDRYGCSPVAVIAYEDRGQVDQIVRLAWPYAVEKGRLAENLSRGLCEFANPTPPKPDEPQGLGAVVEDAEGESWIRCRTFPEWVHASGDAFAQKWEALTVVRVLSEGVVA